MKTSEKFAAVRAERKRQQKEKWDAFFHRTRSASSLDDCDEKVKDAIIKEYLAMQKSERRYAGGKNWREWNWDLLARVETWISGPVLTFLIVLLFCIPFLSSAAVFFWKFIFIVSSMLVLLTILCWVKALKYDYKNSDEALGIGRVLYCMGVFMLSIAAILYVAWAHGAWGVKSVFLTENGCVYHEKKEGYVLYHIPEDVYEITVPGDVSGKAVKEIDARALRAPLNVTSLTIDNAHIKIIEPDDGYDFSSRIKNIRVLNGSLDLAGRFCQSFSFSVSLEDSTLFADSISFKSLDISGHSEVDLSSVVIRDVIVCEGTDLNHLCLQNTKESGYLPIGGNIYLPVSVSSIPEGIFGNEGSCSVYYSGTKTEWNRIAISKNNNSNLTNGNMSIYYSSPYIEY